MLTVTTCDPEPSKPLSLAMSVAADLAVDPLVVT
jgi:hypothetical protein